MPDSSNQDLVVTHESDLSSKIGPDLLKAKINYKKQLSASKDEEEAAYLQTILDEIDVRLKERDNREVIEADIEHEPREIPLTDDKISIGPPTLTRFEKARIMGARALQLSLGAPPFIPIPDTAQTSLDIAMEELEIKAIPITIRRALPNGDYQNIPITHFK